VTDGATREALASLEGAAVERLAGEVARAREVLRLAEEMARALHSDHDSDVAALWRARVAPLRDGSARERARRTAEADALREAVATGGEALRKAEGARERASAALDALRHELAQRIARRTAWSQPVRPPDDDPEV